MTIVYNVVTYYVRIMWDLYGTTTWKCIRSVTELLEATVGNLRKQLLSAFHCTSPLDKSVHSVI